MRRLDEKGFSLIELLIVIMIITVLITIALPSFNQWRTSLSHKDAAWGMAAQLRLARQLAISNNLESRVEFGIAAKQYRLTQGNQVSGSTVWTVVRPWTILLNEVKLMTGAACTGGADINITFKPRGSSDSGVICVEDSSSVVKFKVNISPINGRVFIN